MIDNHMYRLHRVGVNCPPGCDGTWERGGVMTPVPNKPKTPTRTFRVPDDIYEAAQKRAAEKGETVTDVVVRALKRYGKAK